MPDTAVTPSQFPPPPRELRKNPATLGFWQFMLVGRAASVLFVSFILLVFWYGIVGPELILPTFGTETTGRIIDGGPYLNKGRKWFHFRYTYSYDGRVIQTQDDVWGELRRQYELGLLKPGDPIRVRYVHNMFLNRDEIVQARGHELWCPCSCLAFWLAGIVALTHPYWLWPRRMRRLCQSGGAVEGVIQEIGGRLKANSSWVRYRYQDAGCQSVENIDRVCNTEAAKKLAVGGRVTVLTLGRKSMIYELGAYLVKDATDARGREE